MCKVNWCCNKPIWNNYCRFHYDEIRKFGKVTGKRPNGKRNEYVVYKDYAELIILNRDNTEKVRALIDREDIDKLRQYSFRYDNGHYIKGVLKNKTIYLHRLVMNYNGALEIDHINRNKLDNRKCNLRIVDRTTNANNITKKLTYGITKQLRKLKKPYQLKIRKKYIGYYSTIEEAIKVRDNFVSS